MILKFILPNIYWKPLLFSNVRNGNAYSVLTTALQCIRDLKTLHPGGIRTRDLLFWDTMTTMPRRQSNESPFSEEQFIVGTNVNPS
jgi:hypothetical protein